MIITITLFRETGCYTAHVK